jgi:hypothetical protein
MFSQAVNEDYEGQAIKDLPAVIEKMILLQISLEAFLKYCRESMLEDDLIRHKPDIQSAGACLKSMFNLPARLY